MRLLGARSPIGKQAYTNTYICARMGNTSVGEGSAPMPWRCSETSSSRRPPALAARNLLNVKCEHPVNTIVYHTRIRLRLRPLVTHGRGARGILLTSSSCRLQPRELGSHGCTVKTQGGPMCVGWAQKGPGRFAGLACLLAVTAALDAKVMNTFGSFCPLTSVH